MLTVLKILSPEILIKIPRDGFLSMCWKDLLYHVQVLIFTICNNVRIITNIIFTSRGMFRMSEGLFVVSSSRQQPVSLLVFYW